MYSVQKPRMFSSDTEYTTLSVSIEKISVENHKDFYNYKLATSVDNYDAHVNSKPELYGKEIASKFKILLVEDDPIIKRVHENFLTSYGYQCEIASNVGEAIRLYGTDNKFDLVLLDIGLPDTSGLEACKVIRYQQQLNNKKTPILALTAFGNIYTKEYKEAGFDGLLTKPVDMHDLRRILAYWLKP